MKQPAKLRFLIPSFCCLALAIYLSGCAASSRRLERLRVGMTRDEVTKSIGRPRSTTAQAGTEVLLYQFTDKPVGDGMIFPGTYYVQLNQVAASSVGVATKSKTRWTTSELTA